MKIEPVAAASVILVREGSPSFEIFMVRRHIKSDFAADVFVFPGGKADGADRVRADRIEPVDPPRLAGRSEPKVGWQAVYLAAIRELFEEAGVLLARRRDGEPIDLLDPDSVKRYARRRRDIRAGRLTLAELAEAEDLRYAAGELRLFSNWITPEVLSKRFDTFFFTARLPPRQHPRHTDLLELTDSVWITPAAALERHREGTFPLVFATERHLQRLRGIASTEALVADQETIIPVTPKPVRAGGAQTFVIPGDPGFEGA